MRPILCLLIGGVSVPIAFSKLAPRHQDGRMEQNNHTCSSDSASETHLPPIQSCTTGSPPRLSRLIFIRHGQYNVKGRTPDEKVLTNLGWMQAYAAGRHLRRLGIRIDRLIHSDMIRARQTTAALLVGWYGESELFFDTPLLTNLAAPAQLHHNDKQSSKEPTSFSQMANSPLFLDNPYEPYPGADFSCQQSRFLTEGAPPFAPEPPNQKPTSPSTRQLEGARIEQGYRTHIGHHLASNCAPSVHECSGHVTAAQSTAVLLSDLSHRDLNSVQPSETIVFVGHANVFRFWLCRALGLPPEAWLRFQLQHGSISAVDIYCPPHTSQPECTVLARRIGETGHLPKHMLSR